MKNGMRLLVGLDGSEHSKKALSKAIKIATRFSGYIEILTIYKQGKEQEVARILDEGEQLLTKVKIEHASRSILGSNFSRALVNTAIHDNFDLIVVGSRGLRSTAAFLLGSVSKQVVTNAHCDVLVVKK